MLNTFGELACASNTKNFGSLLPRRRRHMVLPSLQAEPTWRRNVDRFSMIPLPLPRCFNTLDKIFESAFLRSLSVFLGGVSDGRMCACEGVFVCVCVCVCDVVFAEEFGPCV